MRQKQIEQRMTGMIVRLAAALALLLTMLTPAIAAEVIRSFSANITVLQDGSVDVTEIIEVRAEGDKIRRGIYRDIPTLLLDEDEFGNEIARRHTRLDVHEVLRDGEAEPWFTEGIQGGTRIYIGESDVFLRTGVYRYTIHYTMTRAVRYNEQSDELYWNATGNFWDFPILDAVATITLPDDAVVDEAYGYTGELGSTDQDVAITQISDNRYIFRATRSFPPYEGMTIGVVFEKGAILPPGTTEAAINFLSDYRATILPGIMVALVLLYYLFAWDGVGRDPKKGVIIPRFYPPKGYSPALVHYIWTMGWKNSGWQAFTAALINLAVKGLITIGGTKKKTRFEVTDSLRDEDLPPGEELIYAYLVSKGTLVVDKDTGAEIQSKKSKFIETIQTENRTRYFNNNILYTVGGVALSLACLIGLVLSGVLAFELFFVAMFGSIIVGVLLGTGLFSWSGRNPLSIFQYIVFGVLAANFLGIAWPMIDYAPALLSSFPILASIAVIIINVLFAILLRAPTVLGRRVMDEIEGFRMYLETAEKERLNFVDEPDMTTARFEGILPFAVALGVEKPWTERFEADLSRHAVSDTQDGYSPHWYRGSSFSSSSLSNNVSSLATGMSAAMIASRPASASGSGSSGGGFSGGGGGGGGGGGW